MVCYRHRQAVVQKPDITSQLINGKGKMSDFKKRLPAATGKMSDFKKSSSMLWSKLQV